MNNVNIKDYIRNELHLSDQSLALDFVSFLEENGVTFYKDNCDCWKDKIYYWCKYNNDCVCFISIKDPDEPQNLWTVWSDDIKSEWFENYDVDDEIKELAWKHIDHCGHCGSCGGGRRKVIFGREFKAVCGCTFRVDNPNKEDLQFLKRIIEIQIAEGTEMKTLTICGSMKFCNEMKDIAYYLETEKNYNILQCVYCPDDAKPDNDELKHLKKLTIKRLI